MTHDEYINRDNAIRAALETAHEVADENARWMIAKDLWAERITHYQLYLDAQLQISHLERKRNWLLREYLANKED